MKCSSKITVVGAGAIGSTILYTLMLENAAKELVLVNRNRLKGKAKASDISHCTGFNGGPSVIYGGYEESMNSDIVIITAGVLPDENGTRMDVLKSNIDIYKELIPELIKYSPNCILLILTNPMDVMTYAAYKISGFPKERVIGTGTLLDTIRLRHFIKNPDGIVIGEHGDSQFPIWSNINIFINNDEKFLFEEKTKRAGWDIRLAKEHSCYAISFSAVKIVQAILGKQSEPLPVSVMLTGQYEINGIYLSLPVKLYNKGVQEIIEPKLDEYELKRLKNSAEIVKGYVNKADNFLNRKADEKDE